MNLILFMFFFFFRPWYVGTVPPIDGKDVVLAVDFSEIISLHSLGKLLKKVVNVLLDTIDTKDRVGISLSM